MSELTVWRVYAYTLSTIVFGSIIFLSLTHSVNLELWRECYAPNGKWSGSYMAWANGQGLNPRGLFDCANEMHDAP